MRVGSRRTSVSGLASRPYCESQALSVRVSLRRFWISVRSNRSGQAQPAQMSSTAPGGVGNTTRSEEHTSELQSLMRLSYAVFCLKNKKRTMLSRELEHPIAQYNNDTHHIY